VYTKGTQFEKTGIAFFPSLPLRLYWINIPPEVIPILYFKSKNELRRNCICLRVQRIVTTHKFQDRVTVRLWDAFKQIT